MIPRRYKEEEPLIINLDSLPTPDLTPEEIVLPPDQRYLRIVVKKCATLGIFGFIDLQTLISLVENNEDDYPEKEGEVLFHCGDGPDMFHLMWFSNSDKGYLLNRWLSDNVGNWNSFPSLKEAIGDMVAAFYGADGYWYRAIVVDVVDERNVRVIFIDYGNNDTIPLSYMRRLPIELTKLLPLSFSARLMDFDSLKESSKLDKETNKDFIRMINDYSLKACLKEYDEFKNVWDICLWRGPEPLVDINEMYRQLLRKRKDTPKLPPRDIPTTDLNKMIHLTHEVNVSEYREVSLKGLRNYRVTYIKSPSEFAVEYVAEANPSFMREVPWQDLMQKFYNDENKAKKYELRTPRVYENRCYAWCNPQTSRWERVRVTKVWIEHRRCQIYVLDVGYFTATSFDDIHELCVEFVTSSALSCSAFLIDIVPSGLSTNWSKESTDAFREIVKGKVFHGIVIKRETVDHGFPETTIRLGIILLDKNEDSNYTVNAHLCKLGLADASGLAGGRKDLSTEVAGTPCFDGDRFKESLEESGRDSVIVDINPMLPSILTGVFPDSPNIESTTWFRRPSYYINWLKTRNQVCEDIEHMPTIIRRRLGICTLIRITSPGCFYIQLAEKIPELEQMMGNLRAQVENEDPISHDDLVDGAMIAVKLIDDDDTANWHRAVVKQYIPKIKMIKVILVDYGAEARTRREDVRLLPPFFRNIPGFCQRVHLDATSLYPLGSNTWSLGAKETFRRYLSSWENQVPVYYFWQPKGSTRIELDEFEHEVRFNPQLQKWEKGVPRNIPHEQHLFKVKNHVLLYNIFCSLGVDIAYEIFTGPNEEYRFSSIWDLLKEKGYVAFKKDLIRVESEQND